MTSTSTAMFGIDPQEQLLAEPERAEVVQVPRGPEDAEPVEGRAELTVAGDLQDGAVAAQHVRPVGGQGGHRGLADDPHPATDRADGDPLDPAGVDRALAAASPLRLPSVGSAAEALAGEAGVLRPIGAGRPGVLGAPGWSRPRAPAPRCWARGGLARRPGRSRAACSAALRASMRRAASAASMRPAARSSRMPVRSGCGLMARTLTPTFHYLEGLGFRFSGSSQGEPVRRGCARRSVVVRGSGPPLHRARPPLISPGGTFPRAKPAFARKYSVADAGFAREERAGGLREARTDDSGKAAGLHCAIHTVIWLPHANSYP